jgi:putative membrane protein
MSPQPTPRKPRAFTPDDPAVIERPPEAAPPDDAVPPPGPGTVTMPGRADIAKGFAWGTLFLSAMASLAVLAASITFARFVSVALAREDWIGWTATGLLAAGGLAGAVILGREIVGLWRLRKLAGLRTDAVRAIAARDLKSEASVASRLAAMLGTRPELAWSLARFREHQGDVHDPGELLALADRVLMVPLDTQARRIVLQSSKRVATVTALSPMALIAVGFVAVENLRMMRALATLYGGRPGFLGALRLARLVVGHLIATGGVALTDDLLGQFLGQDVLRRLSRRLGEGAFNGALTARLGTAAVEVTRPLPFIEATPIRARDFVAELFRKSEPAPVTSGSETRR